MSKKLILPIFLIMLLPAVTQAQNAGGAPASPMRWDIGVRFTSLVSINAKDSYDAVFGGAMTRYGAQLEFRPRPHFLLSLAAETGSKTGERVLPTRPPISTGVSEKLTLTPVHLSVAWIFHPDAQLNWYAGAGPTFLSWKDESAGENNSGSNTGAHIVGGLRWQGAGRWSFGGEVRYSTVPNAVGDAGITKFYNEDDLGGFSISLMSLWRIH